MNDQSLEERIKRASETPIGTLVFIKDSKLAELYDVRAGIQYEVLAVHPLLYHLPIENQQTSVLASVSFIINSDLNRGREIHYSCFKGF